MLITTLAFAAAGVFTGAAAYINLVEQPARLKLPDGALLTEWKTAYQRGTAMQASIALMGGALGVGAYAFEGHSMLALLGAAFMLASWPWTALVIMPTNKKLMATATEAAGPTERVMIGRWARLHLARTAFGAVGVICFATLIA